MSESHHLGRAAGECVLHKTACAIAQVPPPGEVIAIATATARLVHFMDTHTQTLILRQGNFARVMSHRMVLPAPNKAFKWSTYSPGTNWDETIMT